MKDLGFRVESGLSKEFYLSYHNFGFLLSVLEQGT